MRRPPVLPARVGPAQQSEQASLPIASVSVPGKSASVAPARERGLIAGSDQDIDEPWQVGTISSRVERREKPHPPLAAGMSPELAPTSR